MANNQTTNNNVVEVHNTDIEKSIKTMARCAKTNTIITVGMTIVAAAAYAVFGVTIKKMLDQ